LPPSRRASNAELAALMGVSPPGEASQQAKACGRAIVKEREGRTVRLSLPQRLANAETALTKSLAGLSGHWPTYVATVGFPYFASTWLMPSAMRACWFMPIGLVPAHSRVS
jgi:hypothetical protein